MRIGHHIRTALGRALAFFSNRDANVAMMFGLSLIPVTIAAGAGLDLTRAMIVKTIRPDHVFVPYHWPLERAVNGCTNRALDPVSRIPEFKICAVRVSKSEAPTDASAALSPEAGGSR